jgi:hypothetical protein
MGETLRASNLIYLEKDAELLTHIARQIAIAVENALAYREISRLKDKTVFLISIAWAAGSSSRPTGFRRQQ